MRKKRTSTLLLMKRLRLKLHSIPILINNKLSLKNNSKLRYISYSIPLASICALILVLGMAVNPGLCEMFGVDDSYALEGSDGSGDGNSDSDNNINNTGNNGNTDGENLEEDPTGEVLDTLDTSNNDTSTDISDNQSNDVMPLAATAQLTVTNESGNDAVDAALGEVTYTSRKVDVNVSDAFTYGLFISGDSTLTPPAGTTGVAFQGVHGIQPASFTDYTWGYAWGDTTAVDSTMTYYTPNSALVPLDVPALDSNSSAAFSKKITFAAKFPVTAASGSYKTVNGIVLSLITTPKSAAIYWYDGTTQTPVQTKSELMQNIEAGFCKNNSAVQTGWTVTMYDSRDTHPYTVVKLRDGNCWMQDNLALTPPAGGKKNLTSSDTALAQETTSWDLEDKWISDNTKPAMKIGSTDLNAAYKPEYGNYYNWCAATAGSCTAAANQNDVAKGSICPKGWHLPTSGADTSGNPLGEFGTLFGKNGINIGASPAEAVTNIQKDPYKFPLAGLFNGSLLSPGSNGIYWSSTASNSTAAYNLRIDGGTFIPAYSYNRNGGYSVRCVADY